MLVFTSAMGGRGSKLQDRWSGPYKILDKISPVTYRVDMPEHHKRNRAVHITALKRWHPPVADVHCLLAEQIDSSDIPDYRPDPDQSFPELPQHLSNEQRDFFKQVWIDFPMVTSTSPGRMQAAIHRINTGTALPIRLRPTLSHSASVGKSLQSGNPEDERC